MQTPEVTGREPIKLSLTRSAKSREIWSIVPPDKKVKKKRPVPVLTERPNKKFAQLSVADDAFRPKRVLPPFQEQGS